MCVSLFLSLISLVLASQSLGFPLLLVPCFFLLPRIPYLPLCLFWFNVGVSWNSVHILQYQFHASAFWTHVLSSKHACLRQKKSCFVGDLSRKYDYWDSIIYLVLNMHVWTPNTWSVPVPAIIWPIDVCPSYPSPGTEYKTSYEYIM